MTLALRLFAVLAFGLLVVMPLANVAWDLWGRGHAIQTDRTR